MVHQWQLVRTAAAVARGAHLVHDAFREIIAHEALQVFFHGLSCSVSRGSHARDSVDGRWLAGRRQAASGLQRTHAITYLTPSP